MLTADVAEATEVCESLRFICSRTRKCQRIVTIANANHSLLVETRGKLYIPMRTRVCWVNSCQRMLCACGGVRARRGKKSLQLYALERGQGHARTIRPLRRKEDRGYRLDVYVCVRERERESVCVCERERERERESRGRRKMEILQKGAANRQRATQNGDLRR